MKALIDTLVDISLIDINITYSFLTIFLELGALVEQFSQPTPVETKLETCLSEFLANQVFLKRSNFSSSVSNSLILLS